MREAAKATGQTSIVKTFQWDVGCEDEPFHEQNEQLYGSTAWKRRLVRRIERAGIVWRVGKTVAAGCMDWAPTAAWMDAAQDRDMWRLATDAVLRYERYWRYTVD